MWAEGRPRAIIHLNVADFAVAVERALNQRLKSHPVLIAADGAARATVYDMSEEAYQNGVFKGMALKKALRFCPDAVVLPPHPDRYRRAMQRFLTHVRPYSPRIEMTDHKGHLFVDLTGTGRLNGPAQDVALRIRRAVQADMGLDPIWSAAPNKLVAKVATRLVKPSGQYIVAPGQEADFIKPLPLILIPGIPYAGLKRLHEFNLTRAVHVTRLSLAQLEVICGRRAEGLAAAVRGIDGSPVRPADHKAPQVTVARSFGNDTNDKKRLQGALYGLIEQAGAELRARRLAAGHLIITLNYSDGARVVRRTHLRPASASDLDLFAAARALFQKAWQRRVRIRRIGLVCDRLGPPPAQLSLFPDEARKTRQSDNLITALDQIRQRFGRSAVAVGRTLAV